MAKKRRSSVEKFYDEHKKAIDEAAANSDSGLQGLDWWKEFYNDYKDSYPDKTVTEKLDRLYRNKAFMDDDELNYANYEAGLRGMDNWKEFQAELKEFSRGKGGRFQHMQLDYDSLLKQFYYENPYTGQRMYVDMSGYKSANSPKQLNWYISLV